MVSCAEGPQACELWAENLDDAMEHPVNDFPPEIVNMQADLQIEWTQMEGVRLASIDTSVLDSIGHSILNVLTSALTYVRP